ncbi:MAG: hypothetical protein R2867_33565 [Caldilineaceae bacterium]
MSQVVAMFAAGSYATDLTRPLKMPSAFSALAELEFLSDLQYHKEKPAAFATLQHLIANTAPEMSELVGNHLFDYIYLLDREKSNQGLAQDSHELAVICSQCTGGPDRRRRQSLYAGTTWRWYVCR